MEAPSTAPSGGAPARVIKQRGAATDSKTGLVEALRTL